MSECGSYFFNPSDHDCEWSWLTILSMIVNDRQSQLSKIYHYIEVFLNTFCRWDQIPFKIFWLFWKNLQKLQKILPAKNVFRFDFKIDGGKSGKNDWKNEIIVIVYDRRSFMSDWISYFWEFKMNDCGSYSYNYRAHDREWSWLMKKMIVPITGRHYTSHYSCIARKKPDFYIEQKMRSHQILFWLSLSRIYFHFANINKVDFSVLLNWMKVQLDFISNFQDASRVLTLEHTWAWSEFANSFRLPKFCL